MPKFIFDGFSITPTCILYLLALCEKQYQHKSHMEHHLNTDAYERKINM